MTIENDDDGGTTNAAGMAAMLESVPLDDLTPEEVTQYIREGSTDAGEDEDSLDALEREDDARKAAANGQQQADPKAPPALPEGFKQPTELELLQQRMAEIQATQAAPQVQAQAAPASPAAPAPTVDPLNPKFNFNPAAVPDQLVQAFEHEDINVRKQAIVHVMQAATQIAFQASQAYVNAYMAQQFEQQQAVQTEQSATQQKIAAAVNDYYSSYPMLNTDVGRQTSEIVATEMQKKLGLKGWSPVLKDAVASETARRLVAMGVKLGAPQPPKPPRQLPPNFAGTRTNADRQVKPSEFDGLYDGLGGPSSMN